MRLFVSFSARKTGNCAQIIDFIKTPHDQVIYYNEYSSFAERLFIIGVYGSRKESPDFIRCFEKWFEGTPYSHHVLGIERRLYQQTMKDSVIDIEPVKMALHGFMR